MKIRRELDIGMWITAYEFYKKAKQENENKGKKELIYSAIAIILAVSSLEAYINRFGIDFLHIETSNNKIKIWKELEWMSLEDKWIVFPKILTGKTFNKGENPYQTFKEIVNIRNFIVHYKAKFISPSEVEGTKINYKNAEKGVKSARDMIEKLHEFSKKYVSDFEVPDFDSYQRRIDEEFS